MCCGARAWRRVALVAGLLLIGLGFGVQAQDQPKQDQPKYEVTGFRDARFGMTEAEVRAAVKKSFAVKDADIKTTANPTEGTTLLIVRVDSLDPGPGPATVTYIFGNKSKKLIQVNVVWGEDAPSNSNDANAMGGHIRYARLPPRSCRAWRRHFRHRRSSCRREARSRREMSRLARPSTARSISIKARTKPSSIGTRSRSAPGAPSISTSRAQRRRR